MKTRTIVLAAAAVMAAPAMASAAPVSTGDWTAWYGCWRAVGDEDMAGPLVCVLPGDAPAAVRIATIADGAITEETVVRADGISRPIAEGGCEGSERAWFSNDGRRVFTRAELECSGMGRVSTGVLGMIAENEWLDAQALTVNGQHAARTMRYRAVDGSELPAWVSSELPQDQRLAQETARLYASAPLDIAAVVEASKNISPPAVEALLAARQHGFGLNAKRLSLLDEQGVPASTIDVMVALSYPAEFAVAPNEPSREYAGDLNELDRGRAAWMNDCYDPYWTTRRYSSDCRSAFGYGYSRYDRYGYSPYGYDPYGWNYGSRPVVVIVRPSEEEPTGGTAVKGRGYSRDGQSTGTATRRSQPSSSASSVRERSGSSSGSTATKSSSGSTETKSTRTAKRRGNNN